MAVKLEDFDASASTGAVKFDASPQESSVTLDDKSTGAVKMPKVEEVRVDYHAADAVVNVPTPGPVTMTVSWLPETKFVGPKDEKKSAVPSPVADTKVVAATAKPAASKGNQAETA